MKSQLSSLSILVMLNSVYQVFSVPERISGREHFERECPGSSSGYSTSGNAAIRYRNYKRRYEGCTKVVGNLELVFLDDRQVEYDLSFLSRIREVTGYVLILAVYADIVPLTSLEVIRGKSLWYFNGDSLSLFAGLNYDSESMHRRGLRELQLPSLREISRGNVSIYQNRQLCYVHSINWDWILAERDQRAVLDGNSRRCRHCSPSCSVNGVLRCWGQGPRNCQRRPFWA